MLPGPDLSRQPGPVSFISQSGGLSIDFAYMGKWRGIQFSKMISFGNGCDLRETEMLTYLRHDPTTRIICLYIEGVNDGRKFFEVLGETALEKPVIMLKGGLSESGTRAVTSHTASMGGNRKIWESALRQSNVVQVETLQEMADSALAFSMLPVQEYKGLTIVGGGGALGVNSADMAESSGFLVPYLRKDLQDKIRKILPQPGSSPANPIDIANPYVAPEIIHETIIHASEDENIDIHVMIQLIHTYKALATILEVETIMQVLPLKKLVAACSEAKKSGGKPIAMVLPNYKQEREAMDIEEAVREARALFITAEIPVFDQVKNALKAIASVSRYVLQRNAMISSLKN
jgi:acyl-CoA synthetase (NDP forming)